MDVYLEKVSNRANLSSNNSKGDIIVAGVDDILVTLANCCKPVKGDKIIGYITKGEGICVHKADCPNIKNSHRFSDSVLQLLPAGPVDLGGGIRSAYLDILPGGKALPQDQPLQDRAAHDKSDQGGTEREHERA